MMNGSSSTSEWERSECVGESAEREREREIVKLIEKMVI